MRLRPSLLAIPLLSAIVCLAQQAEPPAVAAQPKAEPAFNAAGVAFLKTHCAGCHSGAKPKADFRVDQFTDEAALLKDRKAAQRVLDVLKAGEMPPESKPKPALADQEAFVKAVEGAFHRHDATAKPDPGRVTMRRLNRNEYNHTIRDLVGVDFNPAEDFPSDDVGYGFDNIGDVLTVPPVLLERYLAAAESIMRQAVTPVPPPVTARWQGGQYTEPASAKVPLKNNWRAITVGDAKADGVATGPVHTPYKVPDNGSGEFTFRTRLYAETTGTKPVKVAVLAVCDKTAPGLATDDDIKQLSGANVAGLRPYRIVQTLEVKARTEKEAQQQTVKVTGVPGLHRMALALVKPEDGEPNPTVYLQFMALDGPLDSRPATHHKLLACDPKATPAEQSRQVLERFAGRAYRRPATRDEVDRLIKVADSVISKGEKWEAGMQLAMTAALCSPKFLFRVELDDRAASAEPHPIDEYQLASRLSYFLWATMPDQELFDLAAKKQLTPQLDAQVKRMLCDPRAKTLTDHFVMQWLQLQPLRNAQPDAKKFPQFNEPLRAAMVQETKLFFEEIVREDRSVLTVLDADFTYLNAPLARHYGIADTAGNRVGQDAKSKRPGGQPFRNEQFVRVNLAATGRGGVLTQASVLTVTSNPGRTSPVKRGRWVLEQILGTPPPPPPPNVPELEKDGKPVSAGTLRQQMEAHRANPACANCHAKMDGLGFGLENFDAVGAFRTKDGDAAIDSSGELPGNLKFTGPTELKQILLGKKDLFAKCLTEKLMTYGLGRGLDYYDRRAVDQVVAAAAKNDYKLSVLIAEIVKSDPFRLRRGKDKIND
ncbi:DUF1592 domain-containing protein [Gemmata sp.]|uniref:DUF1592 domain-containing protein n=1 Tax=Gemmata sp. TaxID=1914242 RepID=UPI003F6F76AF